MWNRSAAEKKRFLVEGVIYITPIRKAWVTGQCLAFRLHLAGLLLHHRENGGDFFQVQIGRDPGVNSPLDYGSQFLLSSWAKTHPSGSSTNVVSQETRWFLLRGP
jgi:hypothetical protein